MAEVAVVVWAGEVEVVADDVDCPGGSGYDELPHAESATTMAMLTEPANRTRHVGLVCCPMRSSRTASLAP